ncbi:MAG: hypothetical protein N2689_03255 [Verrucomicrobiae bacterium]|nr:hypothetical protein [Verrucomicrobiae bacterium]
MNTSVARTAVIACLILSCSLVRAETGATNIINGVTTNAPGDFSVGTNGPFNALIVTNAGVLNVSGAGSIGFKLGASNNNAWIIGPASRWSNSGSFYVGNSGARNSLIITNGGRVINGNGYIGNNAGASNNSVWVGGADSVWSNRLNLFVGNNGPGGSLAIATGGTVIASNVTVGAGATSTGNVITLNDGFLFVTNQARTGTLDIRRGALTFNSGTVTVNRLFVTNGASSAVTFNGGTLNSGNSLVNNNTQFRVGNGVSAARLNLDGGAHWFANGLSISANATLSGTGVVAKPVIGGVTNAGVIAPGNSAGSLAFDCDLALLNTALLSLELGGTNDWLYDQINVEETFDFQGVLDVSLLGGFTPQFGDEFDLFDFSVANGRFSRLNLPALDPALYWNTDYLYTTGQLLVGDRQAAWMISPADGSAFASSEATFVWDRGVRVSRYALWVGSTPGGYDLYAGIETGRSRTVTLPTDGRLIYVTLWSWVNGAWERGRSYTYTASTAGAARMLSPANGTTLADGSATFIWDAGVGATQYALWVGSSPNSHDLYAGVETSLSRTLTLPADGRTLHVTLWSWINGAWQSNAYTYTAYTQPGLVKAKVISPTNGSNLTSTSLELVWDAGEGVTQYALWVGSRPMGFDIFARVVTGLTRTVTVPADGRTIYVTLWSFLDGVWQPNFYTYTAPRAR